MTAPRPPGSPDRDPDPAAVPGSLRAGSAPPRPEAGREIAGQLRMRRGDFQLEVAVQAPVGTTVVFGASGAGKSTLLRAVAGLERAEGELTVGGDVWLDSAAGVDLPPHERATGFVFQSANLLPHLDVVGNLRYGARRASGSGPEWEAVIEGVGLRGLLARAVGGLSGGERQRVALGRALLRRPRILLFDEPLSALDEPTRRELMPLLAGLAREHGLPLLHVTHSLDEALRLGERMIWLEGGRVRAAGPLAEVTAAPEFVRWRGDDAGVLVEGRLVEQAPADHLSRVRSPWGDLWVRTEAPRPIGTSLRLRVQARDVSLALVEESHSTLLNQLPLTIVQLEPGDPGEVLVRLAPASGASAPLLARVTARSVRRLDLRPGLGVFARVKAVAVVA